MKKIILPFILIASSLIMHAQSNYQISAFVLTANYQNYVPNYPVMVIDSSSTGSVAIYSYITDVNGAISDSILSQGTNGALWFLAPDSCGFTTIVLNYSPNSPSILATAGLVLCNNIVGGGSPNCNYTVNALPVAGIPNQAYFSYNGVGGTTYLWDFGDGNTSTQASPFHTYSQAGTYYYCLQIDSCPSVCDSITVFNSGGCDPYFVSVANGTTVDIYPALLAGQFQVSVNWGDGTIDTYTPQTIPSLPNTISHTYSSQGSYSICFTHSNSVLGCSNTYCDTVTIGATNPTCQASYIVDTVNSQQGTVILWNNSTPAYSTGSNITYSWDFGDGNTSPLPFPVHTYNNPGIYSVCLTITASSAVGGVCTSTFCDSLGVDSLGNLIYKGLSGFVLNVLNPNAIGIEENEMLALDYYPNPVIDVLNIDYSLNEKEILEIELYSLSGTLVINDQFNALAGQNQNAIDVSELTPGIYILNIKARNMQKQIRVVKL